MSGEKEVSLAIAIHPHDGYQLAQQAFMQDVLDNKMFDRTIAVAGRDYRDVPNILYVSSGEVMISPPITPIVFEEGRPRYQIFRREDMETIIGNNSQVHIVLMGGEIPISLDGKGCHFAAFQEIVWNFFSKKGNGFLTIETPFEGLFTWDGIPFPYHNPEIRRIFHQNYTLPEASTIDIQSNRAVFTFIR